MDQLCICAANQWGVWVAQVCLSCTLAVNTHCIIICGSTLLSTVAGESFAEYVDNLIYPNTEKHSVAHWISYYKIPSG